MGGVRGEEDGKEPFLTESRLLLGTILVAQLGLTREDLDGADLGLKKKCSPVTPKTGCQPS